MENERPPLISLVVPVYNEGAYLPAFLSSLTNELAKTNCDYELIIVDDGSSDGTWTVVSEEAAKTSNLHALRLSRNFGKELALCAGLEQARGDAVIVMDGEGQHPPALLPEMVRLWRTTGAGIVEAVKTRRGPESFFGRMGALFFYLVLNKLAGVNLKGIS